jgi:hypothetical protein
MRLNPLQSAARGPEPAPDLAALLAAWPDLPEPIRAGIMAMVRALGGKA